MREGRLDGDLILVAQGDLTFGGRTDPSGHIVFKDEDHTYANGNTKAELTDTDPLAALKDLARQVKAAGVRHVAGDVLIDARLFAPDRGSGSGPDVLSPILVNDNVVDVILTPGSRVGEPALIRLRPETGFVQTDAQVETTEEGRKPAVEIRPAGPRAFVLRGHVPLKGKPLVRIHPVEDPPAYARALFIEVLRREGVRVDASPLQSPRAELPEKDGYGGLSRVASFRSPPLHEAIKVTLKVSHNLYASTLPLLVAARNGQRTLADGLRLEGKFLAGLGVDRNSFSFGGGAGGSRSDYVTPRATVQLLQAMAKRPEYQYLHDGLPVLGVDGTLADAVKPDSPARGKVFAKTGTLFWQDFANDRSLLTSKALAGTMTTATGRALVVALYLNNVPLPKGAQPSREGKVLGHLCEILYEDAVSPTR